MNPWNRKISPYLLQLTTSQDGDFPLSAPPVDDLSISRWLQITAGQQTFQSCLAYRSRREKTPRGEERWGLVLTKTNPKEHELHTKEIVFGSRKRKHEGVGEDEGEG